ncbi:DUF4159 domain-containing protein [Litorimonas sp. RW-G-Af-16]|uniref:DUF4159 domain-containing protein n=1 Tax=Litorimonas sp. RW-G-Af-16 TaxID=3241168 RepID=UPI00390CA761
MSWAALTFLAPLTFLGLIVLPIIWWILKVSPPRPREQMFPPLRILQDINTDDQTPAATPWWLLLFRMLLAALVVFALAQPIIKSTQVETAQRPTIIIDQSVFAAPIWDDIISEAEQRIRAARRDNLDVRIIATAQINDTSAAFLPASEGLRLVKTLQPAPYPIGLSNLRDELNNLDMTDTDITFLSSGIASINTQTNDIFQGAKASILMPDVQANIFPGDVRETSDGFEADWYRPSPKGAGSTMIEAVTSDNSVIAVEPLTFAPGATLATVTMALPPQLRSKVTRLKAQGVRSAAAIKLLDDSFGRPLVGVLSPPADTSSPLLSDPFYAKQALSPYADIFDGDEATLLALQPSILVMPDSMRSDSDAMIKYVESGGVLVRFAGPRLAKRQDSLLPVTLRNGGRAIGGALAWEDPQRLAPFNQDSPFFGLAVPDEVTVSKQVMAEPGIETDTRTWARLEDGSPIVTSAARGQGRVVLFHVTAGPEWSNLAINGLYVDMLRRILPLTKGRTSRAAGSNADWILDRALDGFGQLQSPPLLEQRIADAEFDTVSTSASQLPGYYRQGTRQRALPVLQNPTDFGPMTAPRNAVVSGYGTEAPQSLTGLLLGLGAALLALDAIFALWMAGRLRFLRPQRGLAILVCAAMMTVPQLSDAQTPDRVVQAANALHLAYIETGDARQDELSRIALDSVKTQLTLRTTIEPEGVHAVKPDDAGLEMYPFLYWPVRRDSAALTPESVANLNAYMAAGGTIVFDTADEGDRGLRAGQPHPGLARVTENLDIPRLVTVPTDHVLTKSFYLLQVFPGRWANGPVYVQAGSNGSGGRDGVSPVIIGSQDWAAGWAIDPEAGSLIELSNDIPRQREMSIRFGVNVAMYTLSGNYKADQVHAAELVERLGRNNELIERDRKARFRDEPEPEPEPEEVP